MATLVGQEGGKSLLIILSKPFYITIRTPLIGRRQWHLRLRVGRYHRELRLYRAYKCHCGDIIREPWNETCANGHSGENAWWAYPEYEDYED